MPEIEEGKKTVTMSYALLAYMIISLVGATFTVTKFYDSTTRIEERLDKKAERLHNEIKKEIKMLEEKIALTYVKKGDKR